MKQENLAKDTLTKVTKLILDVMFFGGIVVTACVPGIIFLYGRYNSYFANNIAALSVIFVISGVLAVLIIKELRKIFKTVLANDCFVRSNAYSLKLMGTYSFLISIITAGRLFLYFTPAVAVVILVFLIAGLFSKVLSKVFDEAVTYKEENDLTI